MSERSAAECIVGRRLDPTGSDERMEQIFPDVACPEGAIGVGREDAPGVGAHEPIDACPYGVDALVLHATRITDRQGRGMRLGCAAYAERTGRSMRRVVAARALVLVAGVSWAWGPAARAQTPPGAPAAPVPPATPGVSSSPVRAPNAPAPPVPPVSPAPPGSQETPAPSPVNPPPNAPATSGAPVDDTAPVPVPDDLIRAHEGGITSEQVFARAAATSWTAKANEETLRGAAARVDEAWASFLPRLSALGKYTRLSSFTPPSFGNLVAPSDAPGAGARGCTATPCQPFAPYQVSGGANPQYLVNVPLAIPLVLNNWLFQGTITVPITDYFLSINQNYSSATRSEEAARWDVAGARAVAGANGRVAYYTWLRARGAVIVAVQAMNDQKTHLRDARNQFAVGNASKADVLRAETAVWSAQLALVQAQNLASLSEKQVLVALHVADGTALVPGEDLDSPLSPEMGTVGTLITEALSARAEVKSADLNAQAAKEQASAAEASRYPNLSAFADGIVANPNPRYFPPANLWFPTWDVGAQVTWSPNDILTANGAVHDAESRAAQILANREQVRDGIQIEVTQYWQNVREADFAIESSTHELASAQEAYRVARELFNNGRGTSTTLTDAETDLTRARLDLLNAKADAHIARVQLEHALGRDVKP